MTPTAQMYDTRSQIASRNLRTRPDAPVVPLRDEPTWPTVVEGFLSEYVNPATIRTWRILLLELAGATGWQHPHEVTAAGLVQFVTLPRKDGKPRANNSVRTRIAVVRTFLAYCHRNHIPAPDVEHALARLRRSYPRLFGKQQGQYEAVRLTRNQLDALFAACQDGTWQGSRDQLLFRLMALGLRRSEVAGLKWHDVKADGHIARLGKMNRLREVFPGPTTADMIAKWRRHYERTIGPAQGDAPVWILKYGQETAPAGTDDQWAYLALLRRARQAGLGHVTPHDLRRTLAKLMNDEGHTLQQIQAALGHAETSGAVTQACYIGPLDNSARIIAGTIVD